MRSQTWKDRCTLPVVAISMALLIACSNRGPDVLFIEQEYIRLEKGQVFTAPRSMTLATEIVVQRKDEQIADLLRALEKLQRKIDLGSP